MATLAAGLMAFAGAFGTGELRLLPRLGYWLILMWSGALIGFGASTGIRSWGRLARRPALEGLVISILIALPLTLVATGATALFFGPRTFGLEAGMVMFAAVFVVTGAITAINYATSQARDDTAPSAHRALASPAPSPIADGSVEETLSPARPRLCDRLPPHLRHADILALEAEDHYVRVHTSAGSRLLLLRLTDAVTELDDLPGARTHRSWWVARAAVRSASKGDGRGELMLVNGCTAPVSRSALPVLTKESWFSDRTVQSAATIVPPEG